VRKKAKKKSTKGKIVKNSKKFRDIDNDKHVLEIPKRKDKGTGIYALYNDYGLYYVGKTDSSLRSRIIRHTKNKHAGRWNKFSWYQIKRSSYAKDIEAIVLDIVNPSGNRQGGRFKRKKRKK